jgi:hypothetical protein
MKQIPVLKVHVSGATRESNYRLQRGDMKIVASLRTLPLLADSKELDFSNVVALPAPLMR